MAAPSKAELHAAIAQVVALPGSAYTGWRQRLRHTLTRRSWAPHGFVPGAEEFSLFLALYDALVVRFGAAADDRFATVLNGITKERQRRRRQEYNAAYRARPQDDAVVTAVRTARAAYMRDYRARPRSEEEVAADRKRKAAYMKRYRTEVHRGGSVDGN